MKTTVDSICIEASMLPHRACLSFRFVGEYVGGLHINKANVKEEIENLIDLLIEAIPK